jgi:hypothetical protein
MATDPLYLQAPKAGSLDLSVQLVKDSPTWTDMLTAFDGMMAANVDAPIEQLDIIRYLDSSTDPEIVQRTVRMLGFDASQDVMSMSSSTLTRLVTQLPLYPDYNSTLLFENFIDLLLNAITSIEYLYTKDYVNFYPYSKGSLVMDGGAWFKTTHINLSVDLLQPETLDTTSPGSLPIFKRVLAVFYTFCPIALVLEHFYFTIKYSIEYGMVSYTTSPDIEIDIDH